MHREPVDSTFYEPNVIVAAPHEAMRPKGTGSLRRAARRHLQRHAAGAQRGEDGGRDAWRRQHPLGQDGYKFVFHTPKYRHGAHTMPIDTDMVAFLFGPFGDVYRHDKRTPFVAEGYVDINPEDAKALGIEDGDYVWIDSDPRIGRSAAGRQNAKGLQVRPAASAGRATIRGRREA